MSLLPQTDQLATLGRDMSNPLTGASAAVSDRVNAEGGQRRIGDVLGYLDQGTARSNASFDSAEGAYGRQTRALGSHQDADAIASANRRVGLSRALSSVDARNRGVGELRNRTDMARSGASDLRDVVESSLVSARGQAAQMEGQREATYQGQLAKYKQDKAAGWGQIAGLAAMFIPGVGPIVSPMIQQAVTKAAM